MSTEEFFSYIEGHYSKNLPFVVYKKPNASIIKALLQNTLEIHTTEDLDASGFVFAPFEASLKTVVLPLKHSETLTCAIEIQQEKDIHQSDVSSSIEGKDFHLSLVKKAVNSIKETQLQKVVLSRYESVNLSKINPINIFNKLVETYPSAFVYCWFHPKIGLWLGATPETLIQIEGKRFKTMALAGTQQYQNSLNVKWHQKEIEEQQFVTDYIVDTLKSSVTNLSVSEAKTIKAGSLVHLQSDISGIINADLKTIIKKLHPTPAVCGLPVDEAKAFIVKNETYNRDYYTGFLGELNLKESTSRNTNKRNIENNAYSAVKTVSNLFVNLRCMQIKNQQALIYVGGGITKDSNPKLEWDETVSKSAIMKRVLMS